MIGFYDYTVIMTYISVVSSMVGIFCAMTDRISLAVCCLAFSGLCDMFDGKIARRNASVFRLIPWRISSVSEFCPSCFVLSLACIMFTELRSFCFTGWQV